MPRARSRAATPSPGFVHSMLKRAFAALGEVDARIRTLVTLAYAVCCDETPLRVGPKKMRRYLLVACTELYTYYMLGDRSMDTFKAFLLPELTGVIVHDRYTVYDSDKITQVRVDSGLAALVHQLCTAHLLRDLAAVAEATRASTGPSRSPTRCAASSTPPTRPARPAPRQQCSISTFSLRQTHILSTTCPVQQHQDHVMLANCPHSTSDNEAQAPTLEMAVTPPSIRKSVPTTYAESSDAR